MFLKRSHPPEPVLPTTPPAPHQSVRRQGAAETLNLIARSAAEAATALRQQAPAGTPDNFVAGQLMALGQVMTWIERELDLLQQQLINEAGLHASAGATQWDAEMKLLSTLPVSSEELFRLAMDYRKVEEETVQEGQADLTEAQDHRPVEEVAEAAAHDAVSSAMPEHAVSSAMPEHIATA
jgi:hypothetical protein